MGNIQEDLRILDQQISSVWEAHGGSRLKDIATERSFTEDETREFEEIERLLEPLETRRAAITAAIDVEERAKQFAENMFRGITSGASEWRNLDSGEDAAVGTGTSIRSHPVFERAAARDAQSTAEANFGSLGGMLRALATGGTGSAIVPTVWAGDLIDLSRSKSAVAQAGATIVPMEAGTVTIGRQTGDPTSAFRAEGSAITASDPTFDAVTLSAKTMSALVVATNEFWQDAPNADQVVRNALAESMAAQLDLVALYGGITAGAGAINLPSPNPNPRGILAALNAVKPANVLGGATNGTTPTVAGGLWNEVLDTYFTVKDGNEEPTAAIYSSKLGRIYAKAVDTTGQPVQIPGEIARLPRHTVNRVPSYTQGSSTTATDLFVANFKQLLIGQRLQITIRPLDQLFAGEGKIGVVASWRGDIQLARPAAFAVFRALNGAA